MPSKRPVRRSHRPATAAARGSLERARWASHAPACDTTRRPPAHDSAATSLLHARKEVARASPGDSWVLTALQ
jgi:hypothetical protein